MKLLEHVFHLSEQGTTICRELMSALTSFVSVAYILFVTPSYLAQTGMDYTGVMIATCLSSALACFLSAAFGMPLVLAPRVGLNAFFTYTLCLVMGYIWEQALAVVSLSGVVYLIISLTPVRRQMISCIPQSMKNAISAGLGLLISFTGLLNSGIIRAEGGALLLGVKSPTTLLAVLGLFIIGVLMACNVKGAMLIGIVVTTLLGFLLGVTQMPESIGLSMSSLRSLVLASDFESIVSLGILPLITAVISLAICLHIDTFGALMYMDGVEKRLEEKSGLGRDGKGTMAVALSTVAAPLLGAPPISIAMRDSADVTDGAKTGLHSVVVGGLFLVSAMLSPVAGVIPEAAISPVLVLIGILMIRNAANIAWHRIEIALPCFLTMITIPFTHSVVDGIGIGFISYTTLSLISGKGKNLSAAIYVLTILFVALYVCSAI